MKNTKILVKTKSKSYPIYFGNSNIKNIGSLIRKNLPGVKKICIISDKNLPSNTFKKINAVLKKYQPKIYKLSVSEKTKDFKLAYKLSESIIRDNFNRSDCIISLGGGIVSDLSAFVASITKRGLKFINIPTTLLAQVDASVGGKTAVNSIHGKNLIGTFYQPDFVLVDIALLDSLPQRELICGYGEILKHSLILNKKFFLWLNQNAKKLIYQRDKKILKTAIIESCKIKSKIISADEKENNNRMILNFGHTFAHGFEGAKNFSNKLNHGEAVLLGMILASKLSNQKKLMPLKDLMLIEKHYKKLNLPRKLKKKFRKNEINKIINFMKKDKKNFNDKINLILLKKIGKTTKPNKFNIEAAKLKKFLSSNFV
tara:strand:+ start:5115 stop:6227 length:1113 start_codon:yes stop_codon:yes gene_type:complete